MFDYGAGLGGVGARQGRYAAWASDRNGLLRVSHIQSSPADPVPLFPYRDTGDKRAQTQLRRETLCVAFIDVVGFSALMHADEESTFHRWTDLRDQVVAPLIREFAGTMVKSTGDGILATFPDPVEAVRWSRDVQTQARRRRQSLALRVALNYCPVLRDGDDLLGDGVNIAARLQEHVDAGGVILTQAVENQLSDRLDIETRPVGTLTLRNIREPVSAFELVTDGRRPPLARQKGARLPTIAVMPFVNLGDNERDEYFASGLVDDVIISLSGQRDLTVISRSSTLSFARQTIDPRGVGDVLGVRYMITGTLRRNDTRIVLSAELLETDSGEQLTNLRREFPESDMFRVQDEIVEMILTHLMPGMLSAERQRTMRKWPGSFSAYDNYLRAQDLIGSLERELFEEAGIHFQRAIKADPGFSLPLAWAARWHTLRVGQGWSQDPKKDALEAANLAMQAIRMDQKNALALAVYGHVQSYLFGDFENAIEYLDRAREVTPNSSTAWLLSSVTLASLGRSDEAIAAAERALRLSPFDQRLFIYYAFLGTAHYGAGNYRRAAKWLTRGLVENPRYTSALRTLAATQVALGQQANARETIARLVVLEPGFSLANYRRTYRLYTDPEKAALFYARLEEAGAPQ